MIYRGVRGGSRGSVGYYSHACPRPVSRAIDPLDSIVNDPIVRYSGTPAKSTFPNFFQRTTIICSNSHPSVCPVQKTTFELRVLINLQGINIRERIRANYGSINGKKILEILTSGFQVRACRLPSVWWHRLKSHRCRARRSMTPKSTICILFW